VDRFLKRRIIDYLEKKKLPEITPDELSQYDGKDGKPAYVAVNGIVYNVSEYPVWSDGSHFGLSAGTDVSESFRQCHDNTILEKLEIVGKLVQ